uniref:Uncharacterized protein n=1 Tax=Arundo donax TaxID=35708 RepID=A0A0A9EQZ5_ARUDO
MEDKLGTLRLRCG